MNCKVCNTRMSPGDRQCPNCGNDAGPGSSMPGNSKPGPLPSAKMSRATDPEDDVELELNEVSGESSAPAQPKPKPVAKKAKPVAKKAEAGSPFSIDASGLRGLLAEQPGSLEKGLRVYRENGKAVGAGYSSPVGEIDLLATDSSGDIVVVTVMEKNPGDELLADVLKRLGWARKHLAEAEGKRVRGIVLCSEEPKDLSYTAAAVADTVSFKTYRLALDFEDIEI